MSTTGTDSATPRLAKRVWESGTQPSASISLTLSLGKHRSRKSPKGPHCLTLLLFHPLPSSSILFHPLPSSSILSILFHRLPSSSILFHPLPSSSILLHPLPSSSILLHPLPSSSILFHPLPSSSILFHPLPSSYILFHPLPSSSILFHPLPSSYILLHPLPSSSILLHPLPSSSILFHPLPSSSCLSFLRSSGLLFSDRVFLNRFANDCHKPCNGDDSKDGMTKMTMVMSYVMVIKITTTKMKAMTNMKMVTVMMVVALLGLKDIWRPGCIERKTDKLRRPTSSCDMQTPAMANHEWPSWQNEFIFHCSKRLMPAHCLDLRDPQAWYGMMI